MILKKEFRLVYVENSKTIIFADKFDSDSTTTVGKGLIGIDFISEKEMNNFIKKIGLTFQPLSF
ncbi:MAG: hypothetical protein DRP08_01125 [Candidatus Aenigmatarchaeota archaeon]|nr:MAG: hypothetical protein DRP08_01125 [Candidatus Aenigmarchaeota archaeon]